MATAQFHKNQRVFVKPVGTWAIVEKVLPQWAKGLEQPIRIFYDVGLGREFGAEELVPEGSLDEAGPKIHNENWRIVRARNKWHSAADCGHHPYPGTYPTIVTRKQDWGGWRVPGAEYDLDPHRIERQARMIANAQKSISLLDRLVRLVEAEIDSVPNELVEIARESSTLLQYVREGHRFEEVQTDDDLDQSSAPSQIRQAVSR